MLNRQAINSAALGTSPRRLRVWSASAALAVSASVSVAAWVDRSGGAEATVTSTAPSAAWVDRVGHTEALVWARMDPPWPYDLAFADGLAKSTVTASAWVDRSAAADGRAEASVEASATRHTVFADFEARSALTATGLRYTYAEVALDAAAEFDPRDQRFELGHVEAVAKAWMEETSRIHAGGFVYVDGGAHMSAETGVNGVYTAYAEGDAASTMAAKAEKLHGGRAHADVIAEFRPKPLPGRGALVETMYPAAEAQARAIVYRPTHAEPAVTAEIDANPRFDRGGFAYFDGRAEIESTSGFYKGVRRTLDVKAEVDARPWRVRTPGPVKGAAVSDMRARGLRMLYPEIGMQACAGASAEALLNLTDPAPEHRRMTVSEQDRVMVVNREDRVMTVRAR